MKFAVIETGGKQYKVSSGQKLKIEKIKKPGEGILSFDKVLLAADGENVKIGSPYVEGAKVEAKIIKEGETRKKSCLNTIPKPATARKKGTGSRIPKWKSTR